MPKVEVFIRDELNRRIEEEAEAQKIAYWVALDKILRHHFGEQRESG